MIISRYIGKELIASTLAITVVLLVVIVSGRFVDYLADAAAGELPADLLGFLLLYKLPGFIQLILPLGFFIALMLSYGRMYVDSEIVVLQACGLSQRQLLMAAWMPALLVLALVTYCSVVVAPAGEARLKAVMDNASESTGLSMLVAGRFQYVGGGLTVYVRELNDDKTQMQNVFVVQEELKDEQLISTLAIANSAYINVVDGNTRYLVLTEGRQYRTFANSKQRAQVQFKEFALKLPESKREGIRLAPVDALPTQALWLNPSAENLAALHWRVAMPLMLVLMTLIGFSLSRTNHRKGRYGKLLPGIILFFVYFTALSLFRGLLESGQLDSRLGMWPIHVVMLLVALALSNGDAMRTWLSRGWQRSAGARQ